MQPLSKASEPESPAPEDLDIKALVRGYVQETFFLAVPNRLEDATPLITSGIIDSIDMIGLVAFIEDRFKIELKPSDINVHGLDTLTKIEAMVRNKLESLP